MEGPGVPHERVHISMPMHALIRVHDNLQNLTGEGPEGTVLYFVEG